MPSTLIAVDGEVYDVSSYISQHPGEGIRGVYMRQYNRKDCSVEFDQFHMTDEPYELLSRALVTGHDPVTGIRHICAYVFRRRIPKGLIRVENSQEPSKYMEGLAMGRYAICGDRDAPGKLILVWKSMGDDIGIHVLRRAGDESWFSGDSTAKWPEDLVRALLPEGECRPVD